VDTSRNPETMTPAERDAEIASILARGVVRAARAARERLTRDIDIDRESVGGDGGLELPRHGGLSVSAPPTGPGVTAPTNRASWCRRKPARGRSMPPATCSRAGHRPGHAQRGEVGVGVVAAVTRRAGGSYFDLDVVAADADGVGAHVVIGRRAGTPAGLDEEGPVMQRADDLLA